MGCDMSPSPLRIKLCKFWNYSRTPGKERRQRAKGSLAEQSSGRKWWFIRLGISTLFLPLTPGWTPGKIYHFLGAFAVCLIVYPTLILYPTTAWVNHMLPTMTVTRRTFPKSKSKQEPTQSLGKDVWNLSKQMQHMHEIMRCIHFYQHCWVINQPKWKHARKCPIVDFMIHIWLPTFGWRKLYRARFKSHLLRRSRLHTICCAQWLRFFLLFSLRNFWQQRPNYELGSARNNLDYVDGRFSREDEDKIATMWFEIQSRPIVRSAVLSNKNWPYKQADLISGLLTVISIFCSGPGQNWPYKRPISQSFCEMDLS